jgi:hypothetical protein
VGPADHEEEGPYPNKADAVKAAESLVAGFAFDDAPELTPLDVQWETEFINDTDFTISTFRRADNRWYWEAWDMAIDTMRLRMESFGSRLDALAAAQMYLTKADP